MSKSVLHVVPHDQHWAVKREGNERASSTHPTQKEAIEAARELAKELDDIVIHRPDGTIRERVTYFGANGQSHETPAAESRSEATAAHSQTRETTPAAEATPQDVRGVESRVSWEAVFAGAVCALAAYVVLSMLALALGLTISDQMWGRGFTVNAVTISGLILVLSLFLGGYIASAATAGEQPREAGVYGVLVWGVVLVLLLGGGLGYGFGHLSGLRQLAPANATVRTEKMKQELELTDQQVQRYEAMVRDAGGPALDVNTARAAWWATAGVAFSLLSAIAGGWVGAGPALVLRQTSSGGTALAPAPKPA
jgi:hypothetical protein